MPDSPSPSRVVRIPAFRGSLASRALYVYLPPGYEDEPDRAYPILYMHDGQNVFEAFKEDSYAGVSWQADQAADELIAAGELEPLIIVGVSNGKEQRTAEYLPPYITLTSLGKRRKYLRAVAGRADRTVAYYMDDVDPYISEHYRVLPGRENRATGGSSMGGLLSNYFAWEAPEFARNHAIVSPSYWMTRNQEGGLEMLEWMYFTNAPDVRIWLDSGTEDRTGEGDDGMPETIMARDILLEKGFTEGRDFRYYLAEGATHDEASWAKRLPMILKFLFPKSG